MTIARILTTAALSFLTVTAADARPRSHHAKDKSITCTRFGCTPVNQTSHRRQTSHSRAAVGAVARRSAEAYTGDRQVSILGHRPRGCPHRYCGCGLSLKLFGKIIPRLNLASNWPRTFPREHAPRAGLVAARHGHVMLLIRHVEGRNWLVFDPNSGGGLTREHVRGVAGYIFVNPHASTSASLTGPGM